MRYLLMALLAATSPSLLAAVAVVEGVQMPAWVEHDGMKTPLAPGAQLQNSDVLTTGDGGRAAMKLNDGSLLKLGENAHMSLDNLVAADKSHYRIALAVDRGAFRMTSATVTKKIVMTKKTKKGSKKITKNQVLEASQRNINVHLGSLNASAAGGDIWGKAGNDRDVVALLRGSVNITHDDASQATLTRPKTFVDALNGATLTKPRALTAGDASAWLGETGLATGHGVATRKGTWKVCAGTFSQGADAADLKHKLAEEGYAAELASAKVSGRTQTRVQLSHLQTDTDAHAIAERIAKEFDLDTVTVTH